MIMNDQGEPGTEHTMIARGIRALGIVGLALGAIGIFTGIGGMLWLQTSSFSHAASSAATTGAQPFAAAATSEEFLHAPATDTGVPSAAQVFAGRPQVSDDDPPAPTF
jgi:hypothetical protein